MNSAISLALMSLLLAVAGCGGSTAAPGGTKGTIRHGTATLSDVQVTVHRGDHGFWEPVGFGVSGADGQFELRDNLASGPLWLTPGRYRFTIESVGPTPLAWSPAHQDPAQTPLRRTWTATDTTLDVDVPEPSLR